MSNFAFLSSQFPALEAAARYIEDYPAALRASID